MAIQNDIDKKNSEAELNVLKTEIAEKSAELTSILSQSASLAKERAVFEQEKKNFAEYKIKEEGVLMSSRADIAKELVDHNNSKQEREKALKDLDKDIKESTRVLSRINASCLTGEEELKSLTLKKLDDENKIAEMVDLIVKYEELINSIKEKEDVIVILEANISTRNSEEKEEKAKLLSEIASLKEEKTILEAKRDKAEYELKSYTDQLYTSMNDWMTIRTRLETRWHEKYPELELPL